MDDSIEYYSQLRAYDAVRRADVCLLVVDSSEGLTEQDTKIIGFVHEQGKPSLIVMNKWDLIEKDTNTINKFQAKLSEDLKFMDYFKSIYISAKTGHIFVHRRSIRSFPFPRSHGNFKRFDFGYGTRERAAFLQRQKIKGLLFFTGRSRSANLRFKGQFNRPSALFIRAVFGKRNKKEF